MGAATAWHLARRGREVALLERFAPGHRLGASHGASRNFNLAYADPRTCHARSSAQPLWRELEAETGTRCSTWWASPTTGRATRPTTCTRRSPRSASRRVPARSTRRGSAGRASASTPGCCTAEAGRVNADATVRALHAAAAAAAPTCATHAGDAHRGGRRRLVRVVDTDGGTIEARTAVVALGAWTTKLLGGDRRAPAAPRRDAGAAGPLRRARRGDRSGRASTTSRVRADDGWYWRTVRHAHARRGREGRLARRRPGRRSRSRDFAAVPEQFAALRRYAREWLPGRRRRRGDPDQLHVHDDARRGLRARPVGPVTWVPGSRGTASSSRPSSGGILADLADGHPSPGVFRLGRFATA